ncbi:hypothetical protein [Mangrovibacterium diazotrophicum]|uniref:Uncharacterized protein n=1 Tax=Mangrovibacterium diazotrophicum TaxID=1261403 RepID=A0A419VW65_9BACT|nr:hypothetical protein [Mangrovibacterium diazotrophicum]RKD86385.1 hypothetical protein BC643_4076 [Mangrovibacterium diazotrophicum]
MESFIPGYIVAMIAFFFNLFATHLRNAKWFTYRLRWQISIGLAVIGLFGLFLINELNFDNTTASITLITPLIFTAIDRFFMFISFKYQNRDFQFNTSLESWLNQHKQKLSVWDNIITVAALLILTGLLIISFVIAATINNAP